MLVILLPQVDSIVVDPEARWAVLVLVVVAVGVIVLGQAARAEPGEDASPPSTHDLHSRGPLERQGEAIERGRAGSSYFRMQVMMDLRSTFRQRVMATRGLSREEFNIISGDQECMRRLVADRELRDLLTTDLREESGDKMKGRRFMEYLEELVGKMEGWS